MEFVDAKPLSADYLKDQEKEFIKKLAADFLTLMKELDTEKVGYGDLSPGNVLVKTNEKNEPHIR